jgi:hypothetical protein
MEGIETCALCGIRKFAGQYRWSHTGAIATPDALYSKVCGVAKNKGKNLSDCINKNGLEDKNLAWKPITQEFVEALIEGSELALKNIKGNNHETPRD